MQQVGFHRFVGAPGKRELPLGSDQPSRALDKLVSQGSDGGEGPQRGALFCGDAGRRVRSHLQFAGEAVRHQGGDEVELVSGPGVGGHIGERIVGLQLCEDPLFGTATVVECQYLGSGEVLDW